MAECAHITYRRSPEPARGAVDRRSLVAGLFAAVIGGGITAGVAASVAELMPADPGVKLILRRGG